MMTSSNGNIFRVTGPLCAGNSQVIVEFPSQRTVTWSFDVSLICAMNKRLRKQSRGWLFDTTLRSLLRHCNGILFQALMKSPPKHLFDKKPVLV